jgi:hypothetical protein
VARPFAAEHVPVQRIEENMAMRAIHRDIAAKVWQLLNLL